MLWAGKAAPTELCRANQIIEWIYFYILLFFFLLCLFFFFFFCFLAHCWSRVLCIMKPLTIATGPSGLFWFHVECSADFYWKSHWSGSFSVLWLKWLFKSRNSKPHNCQPQWCSRSWKTQKISSVLISVLRLLLHLAFSFSSFLLLCLSGGLNILGFLCLFLVVLGGFFVTKRAVELGLWQCNSKMVLQAWHGMKA